MVLILHHNPLLSATNEEKTAGQGDASAIDEDVRKITGFRWFLICAALYLSALIACTLPAGIVLLQAGSAVCGAAPTMNALIVGRVRAGAGGTGIYLGGLNNFLAMSTRQERGTYLAATGFVRGLGAILGPVVGGGFSDSSATWRWGLYINLIIGAITAPVYLFYLPAIHAGAGKSLHDRLVRLDYVGFVSAPACGVWAWSERRTIALVVVFALLLVLYSLQYFCVFTTAATRSFPGHLLRSRTQILLYITTTCANTGMFFTAYHIPIYFQFTQNNSSLMAAVRLLPYLLVTITCNLATGWVLFKVQYYMPLCLVSGALMTLAVGLFVSLLSPKTPTTQIYGFSILMAVGTGITMQLGYAVASLKLPPTDIFSAINLQKIAQTGASHLSRRRWSSVSVHGRAELTRGPDGIGFSQTEIHDAVAGAQSTLFESLSGDLRDAAIRAITAAMQRAFIVPLVAGGVGLISSLLMKKERLFG
ncbi:major facilitator superfamily domain-containing protein [Aspergillus foveolatus]|uniref:major facilitator superfamily domain-containing protein n=1 Tax=Aspergillus foveolatus TaxID=210207 RepID=UPI003CCCAC2A